jgi:hypothetical protein
MVALPDLEGLGVEGEENDCCQQSKTTMDYLSKSLLRRSLSFKDRLLEGFGNVESFLLSGAKGNGCCKCRRRERRHVTVKCRDLDILNLMESRNSSMTTLGRWCPMYNINVFHLQPRCLDGIYGLESCPKTVGHSSRHLDCSLCAHDQPPPHLISHLLVFSTSSFVDRRPGNLIVGPKLPP